ncbi:hypothetical protein [Henriciella litoralis]|uniref:hypothetical protein n=1 Tax=Henriciella litoralis TaxID=568102 RepID=UPI000A060788|nr:hypothetical protein [Henriciella litoralis]
MGYKLAGLTACSPMGAASAVADPRASDVSIGFKNTTTGILRGKARGDVSTTGECRHSVTEPTLS